MLPAPMTAALRIVSISLPGSFGLAGGGLRSGESQAVLGAANLQLHLRCDGHAATRRLYAIQKMTTTTPNTSTAASTRRAARRRSGSLMASRAWLRRNTRYATYANNAPATTSTI